MELCDSQVLVRYATVDGFRLSGCRQIAKTSKF